MWNSQAQSAAALASLTGHVSLNYGSVITKNIGGFQVGLTQYVYNCGFESIKKRLFNTTLPINLTDSNFFLNGSTLKDLEELKGLINKIIKYITKKMLNDQL